MTPWLQHFPVGLQEWRHIHKMRYVRTKHQWQERRCSVEVRSSNDACSRSLRSESETLQLSSDCLATKISSRLVSNNAMTRQVQKSHTVQYSNSILHTVCLTKEHMTSLLHYKLLPVLRVAYVHCSISIENQATFSSRFIDVERYTPTFHFYETQVGAIERGWYTSHELRASAGFGVWTRWGSNRSWNCFEICDCSRGTCLGSWLAYSGKFVMTVPIVDSASRTLLTQTILTGHARLPTIPCQSWWQRI